MFLKQITDPYLAQNAYLIGCQKTGEAIIVDPQRDIDRYRQIAKENGLRICAVAETHIHADFLSGTREFSVDLNITTYLSAEGGSDWQYTWPEEIHSVRLLRDGDSFSVGNIDFTVLHTPGHTPEHICFLVTDRGSGATEPMALLTGDFVFVGDVGRPDLLETAAGVIGAREPAAQALRQSLAQKLTSIADYVQILPAHGAGSACGKALGAVPTSTLGYERRHNYAVKLAAGSESEFVAEILTGQPNPPAYFATMKRLNRDGAPVTGGVLMPEKISATECVAQSRADRSLRLIDCREDKAAFAEAHVPGAIAAPLRSALFIAVAGSFVEPHESVILIVQNEEEAQLATLQLYRIGIDQVHGWCLWSELTSTVGATVGKLPAVMFGTWNTAEAEQGILLDVRTTAEYAAQHFPGAMFIPYTELRRNLPRIPRGETLYVHCASGKRAVSAASFLAAEGYSVVHVDGSFAVGISSGALQPTG